ncbi:hypothetical protein TCSYLVIO_010893 [Trypanosoma cruzi]|nr:hypothetical protein TCSYLVIO_010893 [Trypanosoma cruzi]
MQIKTKQKQLRCSAHAARQDGSGACAAKESTNGPAWVCMHIYNGHIIVCASWGEVRARVHARGHTQRERRTSVCAGGARLSLPHSHAGTTEAAATHTTRQMESVRLQSSHTAPQTTSLKAIKTIIKKQKLKRKQTQGSSVHACECVRDAFNVADAGHNAEHTARQRKKVKQNTIIISLT